MGYLANFMVYTLAMVGVIVVALLIFKNATSVGGGKSSKYLRLIDSMSLGQRKTLYIVSTGKEKFLIAGDVDKTCLISKLDSLEEVPQAKPLSVLNELQDFKETLKNTPRPSFMDRSVVGIKSSILNQDKQNGSVIRNIADIMKQ